MNVGLSRNLVKCLKYNISTCHFGKTFAGASSIYNVNFRKTTSARCFSSLLAYHENAPISNGTMDAGLTPMQKRFYNRKKTVKIPPTKVLNFDYGGDLTYDDYPLDLQKPRLEYDGAEQLEHCDEVTKRLLTLEFSDGHDKQKSRIHSLVSKVKEHPLDVRSLEVVIAYQTVAIRNQVRHMLRFRKDKAAKTLLVMRLQARRKHLRRLRAMDYEKFTWLCEELQMKYIPIPQYNRKLSKLATLKQAARNEALRIKREKLEAFEVKILEEREEFSKYKEQELVKIEKEIQGLGLSDSDPINVVVHRMKHGDINELDGVIKQLAPRKKLILRHKFKLAEKVAKERAAKV